MIQLQSILHVADTCGIIKVRCFKVYQKKKIFSGRFGNFIKVSVRLTYPKYSKKFKGRKMKSLFIRPTKEILRKDGSCIKFQNNACFLLKKRLTPRGKLVTGPVLYNLKRKKILTSFVRVM